MNINDLCKELVVRANAKGIGLDLNMADLVVASMFEAMAEAFERGIVVKLPPLGRFTIRKRAAMYNNNPTYLKKFCPSKTLVYFMADKNVKVPETDK